MNVSERRVLRKYAGSDREGNSSTAVQPDVLVHVADGSVNIGVADLSSPVTTRASRLSELYDLIQEQKADDRTGGTIFSGVSREADVSLSR
jgi:hypothetical protein